MGLASASDDGRTGYGVLKCLCCGLFADFTGKSLGAIEYATLSLMISAFQ